MGQQTRISVVIITYNEEKKIGRCLDSVIPVADEILVVDSLSEDRTKEICLAKGATFVEQPFLGYVKQKNFAVERARYDHVLALDADECLSDALRERVLQVKANWFGDGFTMNRLNNYYGRWIKGAALYPDRKLRLWDRRKGRWGGTDPHDKVMMNNGSTVNHLKGDLLHFAYDSIESHVRQANRFSTIAARAFFDERRKSNMLTIVWRSSYRFWWDYLVRRGFLDGFGGFTVCSINAFMTLLKYAKLRELNQKRSSRLSD